MKKIKIIWIIDIIILIFLTIFLIIYSRKSNTHEFVDNTQEEYIMEQSAEEALATKLYPNNVSEFYFKYNGKVNTNDIYTRLYEIIVEGIPNLNSDLNNLDSDEKIQEYYNEQKYIKETLGMDDINDFKNLIDILKQNNVNPLKYKICEIEKSSTINNSEECEFILNTQYENSQAIRLKVIVSNARKKIFIKIIPIIEE